MTYKITAHIDASRTHPSHDANYHTDYPNVSSDEFVGECSNLRVGSVYEKRCLYLFGNVVYPWNGRRIYWRIARV